ncbi:hypothetical protein BC939DRAFT_499656 [Gamsiella multidivaricata]|uniref:uncharacterized protein n=1 Tax=Gamsiella multidivaricata TaxID=101098 RepID=UPI00221E4C1D|nr:uncharacterized protein BC939DRAFT_499656 [Gamsiella multidivaricata]KAI7830538.1 hypothetical protein BC939DRAFT_499656 [Gamsiella multidivaricata]
MRVSSGIDPILEDPLHMVMDEYHDYHNHNHYHRWSSPSHLDHPQQQQHPSGAQLSLQHLYKQGNSINYELSSAAGTIQRPKSITKQRRAKDKPAKSDREEVWPPDIASASIGSSRASAAIRPVRTSCPLWPSSFGFFIQYFKEEAQLDTVDDPHDNGYNGASEKFTSLYSLYEKTSCAFMFIKTDMKLGLNLEGSFENICLFTSDEHRALRCSTLIYSFEAKVLESTGVKQTALINGEFVHSFGFANQFFDSFLSRV